MPDRILNAEFYQFITKVLIPAIIGISLKLSIQMRRTKLSFINVFLSYATGITTAYIFSSIINIHVPENYRSIFIAIIAISSEKIGEFLVYKFRVDDFLAAILDAFKQVIIKMINK
jgi:hypothetical protein